MSLLKNIFQKVKALGAQEMPVVFKASGVEQSTFSEFYTIHICPACHHILDDDKARYDSMCCYKCGHTNGYLFDTQSVVVRDRYVDGKFIEIVVHKTNDDDED